jgi:CheY-like chemotaxis protein/two-component sensor histidine kinase
VAHEINNPLSFVLANITFAADTLKAQRGDGRDADVDDILGALDDAHQGAERVSRIVRDLKTFSRADDERRVPVSLHAALDLSLQMTSGVVRHRARVIKQYGPVPLVDASDSRLGQVFVNLLVNAAQALPDDGKQHLIEVSTHTDYAGRAVVAVRDNGVGIPPEILKRIFDPFFTTKPVGVGTGLGLSICHNIIHALGGEIAVHSRVGAGTTFTVTLPAATGVTAVIEAPATVTAKHPQRRGRVLVVDDEPLIAQAVRRTLEPEADVISETSAAQALSRFHRGEKFDVILCDLMMPEMTGMDLHAALSRDHADQLDRLVFVTGAVFPGPARQFLSEAHRPHIEKPFDPAGLRKVVQSYFELGRAA